MDVCGRGTGCGVVRCAPDTKAMSASLHHHPFMMMLISHKSGIFFLLAGLKGQTFDNGLINNLQILKTIQNMSCRERSAAMM